MTYILLTRRYDHSNSIYHHNSDLNTNNILKYNILASKIIRANTIYQVVVSLSSENSDSCLFMASISKNGMAVTSNQAVIHPDQSQGILLKIPSGKMVFRFRNFDFQFHHFLNIITALYLEKWYEDLLILFACSVFLLLGNPKDEYILRIEGRRRRPLSKIHGVGVAAGPSLFEHQTVLEFSAEFLSIVISPSRAIYNAESVIRIRVLFFTTSLKPYDGIVDLYLLDPDGYIIRKWHSKELNIGVLTETYTLPEYPKVIN